MSDGDVRMPGAKLHAHKTRRMVEFADTDMAGIAHFSNFYRWMEAAEHALFRAAGLSVHRSSPEQESGFARVEARCTFFAPLRYQEWFEIETLVAKIGTSSMRYAFAFRKAAGEHGLVEETLLAVGTITAVHIPRKPGSTELRSGPMPPEIKERLEVAPRARFLELGVDA